MPVILFVDDNKNVREFCQRELGREGYRVVPCEDGYKTLHFLNQETPDLPSWTCICPA
ncbi:MAG: response regulator [Candidatus Handelsmanbacteria bacterium]|nr:response regulator [Candidatus Handelsmanbacteria bacterium]